MAQETSTTTEQGCVVVAAAEAAISDELGEIVRSLGCRPHRVQDEVTLWTCMRSKQPDVVVLDIDFVQPFAGIRIGAELYERGGVRALYLSTHADAAVVARAKMTRPYGYLLKPVRALEFAICLELALHRSGIPTTTHRSPTLAAPTPAAALTRRERDVLRLIVHGHTSKDIASQLEIAKATVDTYRARLHEKLGARGRAELVRAARSLGLSD